MARRPLRTATSHANTRQVSTTKDPRMDGSFSPIPVLPRGGTFSEIGSAGLRQFSGWLREEFLRQLQGREAQRVYREMYDNSPIVNSLVFAIRQAIRQVDWHTEAVADSPAAKEAAEFADSLRFDLSHTWEDFINEVLSMLIYGFAPFEIVYKRRNGRRPYGHGVDGQDVATSAFDDGLIGIRKLPIRGQDTVLKWFFGPNGEILGLTQQPWVGALIDLPIEKMLLFRPEQAKNSPEGRSILRSAYRPYYFMKRLEEQEAIMIERFSGLPVIYVPSQVIAGAQNGSAQDQAIFEMCQKIVTNVRVDEQAGVVLPSDTYRDADGKISAVKMYELQLMAPQSSRASVSPHQSIERYKIDILTTSLADFITMGHEVRGTNNLASVKVDMFYSAVEGWVDSIAAVMKKYLLPKIWRLNGFDEDLMPEYKPKLPRRIDLDGLGGFIANIAGAGALMPDEDLDQFLREAAGLPDAADPGAVTATAGRPEIIKAILKRELARTALQRRGKSVS